MKWFDGNEFIYFFNCIGDRGYDIVFFDISFMVFEKQFNMIFNGYWIFFILYIFWSW